MILNEAGAIVSGKNLHFTVQNMTYGATMPVNRVELTRPDGTTEELEKIRDWYLIGDSFVLYNDESAADGRNNIPDPGKYTITVHATGNLRICLIPSRYLMLQARQGKKHRQHIHWLR